MLALGEYRGNLCPGCGGNLVHTADAANEGKYRPGLPIQCFRCVAIGQGRDAYADQPQPHSFLHMVPLIPGR